MIKQINIFRTAIMFYTRLPMGTIKDYNSQMLSQSTRFFPLVGLVVGALAAVVFWLCALVLPIALALLLSMAFSVYLTGAFHEDGFADFCDGFGGGYTKERVLTIMKDSRIGTYGTVGLLFMLGTKFIALNQIAPAQLFGVIVAGHGISRLVPVVLLYTSHYVREDATSKSKPIGQKDSLAGFIFALACGAVAYAWLKLEVLIISMGVLSIVFFVFRRYILKKIGGYTGDVLGALQQISEVFFYISVIIVQNTSWNLF